MGSRVAWVKVWHEWWGGVGLSTFGAGQKMAWVMWVEILGWVQKILAWLPWVYKIEVGGNFNIGQRNGLCLNKMEWVKINIFQIFMVSILSYRTLRKFLYTMISVDYDLVVRTNFNKLYSYSSSCLIYFVPLLTKSNWLKVHSKVWDNFWHLKTLLKKCKMLFILP